MTNVKLLDRLPCIRLPFVVSGGPCLVPLPCGSAAWKLSADDLLKKHLVRAKNVIIEHPDSRIGALAYLEGLSFRDEDMVLELRIIARVKVKEETRKIISGIEYARFHFAVGASVSQERFFSQEFNRKFDLFKTLLAHIFVLPIYVVTDGAIDVEKINLERIFAPKGISSEVVGDFIDETVMRTVLSFVVKDERIEARLVGLLEELDVEKRLDLAIDFANWLLENLFEELWEDLSDEIGVLLEEKQERKRSIEITEPEELDEKTEPAEISSLARRLFLGEVSDGGPAVPKVKNGEPAVFGKGKKLPRADNFDLPGLRDFRVYLEKRIIGQRRPLETVAGIMNLAVAGLAPKNKPLGSFFFAGPTGTGKTETAEAIADFLYEREKKLGLNYKSKPLVRIDSGIYEGTVGGAITQLIGSSAGYVGSKGDKDGAQKPIFLKENFPDDRIVVVLFDEIEKAFKDLGPDIPFTRNKVGNLLVTILDKGMLLNAWDEWVDFSRTIFIFTSNIGAIEIVKRAKKGKGIGYRSGGLQLPEGGPVADEDVERLNNDIFGIIKEKYEKAFAPELRSRINRLVVFRFHTRDDFRAILFKEIGIFESELKSKHGVFLRFEESAIEWVLNHGVSRETGVRFLQEFLKTKIREEIAKYVVAGIFSVGDTVKVVSEDPNDRDTDPEFFLE